MKLAICITILMLSVVNGSSYSELGRYKQKSACSHSYSSSSSESDEVNCVIRAFELYAIVPEMLPNAPTEKLSIIYYTYGSVNLGNSMFPFKVGYVPYIYWNYKADTLYSIFYINPDVSGVRFGDYKHVFLSGLRVNTPADDILAGDLLAAYSPYLPPTCGSPNRHIFLVYEQKQPINVTLELTINVSTNTSRFDFSEFVNEHDLGDPIAGNYFTSQLYFCNQ